MPLRIHELFKVIVIQKKKKRIHPLALCFSQKFTSYKTSKWNKIPMDCPHVRWLTQIVAVWDNENKLKKKELRHEKKSFLILSKCLESACKVDFYHFTGAIREKRNTIFVIFRLFSIHFVFKYVIILNKNYNDFFFFVKLWIEFYYPVI